MAEITATPVTTAQPAAPLAATPAPVPAQPEQAIPATAPAQSGDDKKFTQAELEAIIKDRLGREREKAAKEAEKAKIDLERKAAEEQGQFKALYEQVKAEVEAAKREVEQVRLDSLRDRVGREFGLPEAIAKRLVGNDEAELKADAATIAAALPKLTAGGTDANRGTASTAKAQSPIYNRYGGKEEFAARLGLNPKFLPD